MFPTTTGFGLQRRLQHGLDHWNLRVSEGQISYQVRLQMALLQWCNDLCSLLIWTDFMYE